MVAELLGCLSTISPGASKISLTGKKISCTRIKIFLVQDKHIMPPSTAPSPPEVPSPDLPEANPPPAKTEASTPNALPRRSTTPDSPFAHPASIHIPAAVPGTTIGQDRSAQPLQVRSIDWQRLHNLGCRIQIRCRIGHREFLSKG
jgi:hypothetical protein